MTRTLVEHAQNWCDGRGRSASRGRIRPQAHWSRRPGGGAGAGGPPGPTGDLCARGGSGLSLPGRGVWRGRGKPTKFTYANSTAIRHAGVGPFRESHGLPTARGSRGSRDPGGASRSPARRGRSRDRAHQVTLVSGAHARGLPLAAGRGVPRQHPCGCRAGHPLRLDRRIDAGPDRRGMAGLPQGERTGVFSPGWYLRPC